MKIGDMVKQKRGTAIGWVTKQHPLYEDAFWVMWIDPGEDSYQPRHQESLIYKENLELVKT